jgi:hypothetical protein
MTAALEEGGEDEGAESGVLEEPAPGLRPGELQVQVHREPTFVNETRSGVVLAVHQLGEL